MSKTWTLMAILLCLLLACGGQSQPTASPAPTPTEIPPATAAPLPAERGELFAGSGVCSVCHTSLTDASGADVSIDAFWRATMMANAARDPYWQATFRAEVLKHPDYQAVIEDKCTTCHTPMARFTVAARGGQGSAFGDGFFAADHPLHALALDGVSCTLCHQILEEHFGQVESYSGHFVIDAELPMGDRLNYGPYAVDPAQVAVMQGASGFVPEQGPHVHRSELCATCHTLYTPYFDAAGEIVGEFPEQTPYLEWYHSAYREIQPCQGCHMPQAQGEVPLSITGGPPRAPFLKHVFVGGNAYVVNLLRQFGDELQVTASGEQFDATGARVRDQLQNRTATLTLEKVNLSGGRLTADVVVESQVGHKFPTGYPARRAWLHFTVRDAGGNLLFESGAPNPDGSIAHNDNDDDPAGYEPHYVTVETAEQVQIYEAIMGNTDGQATTTLLRGAGYLKDNRLLPTGFSAADDIAVQGAAAQDPDFRGGSDRVRYDVPLEDARGPLTVTVELLYQSISYRWAENLRGHQAAEIDRFLGYQEAVPNRPLRVTGVTVEVEE